MPREYPKDYLNENQRKVLDYIISCALPVCRDDMMKGCGIGAGAIENVIGKLVRKGRIIAIGNAKQAGRSDQSPSSAIYALPGTPSLVAASMRQSEPRVKQERYRGEVATKYVRPWPVSGEDTGRKAGDYWSARDLAMLAR